MAVMPTYMVNDRDVAKVVALFVEYRFIGGNIDYGKKFWESKC